MSVPPKQFVDLSEEAALAMACAAHGASRAIEEATGSAPDPELSQKVALFAIGIAWHLHQVAELWLPSDKPSPPWLVHRGLTGWTSNLVLSSYLAKLPRWLGPILALLPLIGWAGWRGAAGLTGLLLFTGYGVFFMLAGRDNNFYWGLMLVPSYAIGLAFVPRALWSLIRVSLGKT